jgi:hypothetical protein
MLATDCGVPALGVTPPEGHTKPISHWTKQTRVGALQVVDTSKDGVVALTEHACGPGKIYTVFYYGLVHAQGPWEATRNIFFTVRDQHDRARSRITR